MAEIKAGAPFGLDGAVLSKIEWALALKRVNHDLRTDFIYAPHLGFIFSKAGDELISRVTTALKSGQYAAGLPLTMEVPKSFRIRVAVPTKRLGPAFSRPGSILMPHDRLFYQALADQAAPIIASKTDVSRSFSHQLGEPDSASMFLPTRACWNALQKALAAHAKAQATEYILKVDVANFFGSLNLQHRTKYHRRQYSPVHGHHPFFKPSKCSGAECYTRPRGAIACKAEGRETKERHGPSGGFGNTNGEGHCPRPDFDPIAIYRVRLRDILIEYDSKRRVDVEWNWSRESKGERNQLRSDRIVKNDLILLILTARRNNQIQHGIGAGAAEVQRARNPGGDKILQVGVGLGAGHEIVRGLHFPAEAA
jgi:hypothetical protein